ATLLYPGVRGFASAAVVGGTSADFLQFEVGGRSAGMGGAQTGVATGVTAQFWNPAMLATIQNPEVGALHASWLQDLSYEWVGYARPLGSKLGVASISAAYFHMPSIQGVDEFNNPTGTFRVYDLALTAGLSRPIARGVNVGANLKMIRQNLATVSATGVAADLGVAATFYGTTVGLAAQNLGPSLSYSDAASYPLPQQIKFGVSRGFLQQRLLVAADYNSPRNYYDDVRLGTEFKAHRNVSVRLGYRHELGTSNDPATGLSYGLGVHFGAVSLDYAMTPSDEFDNVQRFAFGYSFGGGAEETPTKPAPPKKEKPLPPAPPKQPTSVATAPKPAPKAATPVAVLADPKTLASAPDAPVTAPAAAPDTKSPVETPAAASASPAPAKPAPTQAPAVVAGNDPPAKPAKESKPAKPIVEHAVLLLGYSSMESAQSEMKALQLLGFRTKDASIVADPKGGYAIRLAQMKSKDSAEGMVSELARMSFRAVVQTVQR
ncbi:MAG TPA: PorV/PorQ family protein, partial [Candidatus Eisenbacteria bacterium]|nr:PorV/PorQ family protein [Candidatus Eisenbacteria bacterium]